MKYANLFFIISTERVRLSLILCSFSYMFISIIFPVQKSYYALYIALACLLTCSISAFYQLSLKYVQLIFTTSSCTVLRKRLACFLNCSVLFCGLVHFYTQSDSSSNSWAIELFHKRQSLLIVKQSYLSKKHVIIAVSTLVPQGSEGSFAIWWEDPSFPTGKC